MESQPTKRNLLCVYGRQNPELRTPFGPTTAKRTPKVLLSLVAVGKFLSVSEVFLWVFQNTNIAIADVSFRFR